MEDCFCSYSSKVTFRERTGHLVKMYYREILRQYLTWRKSLNGLVSDQTQNDYCGYKNVIFPLSLNRLMFLFNPFCIYRFIFMYFMGHKLGGSREDAEKIK
jgi:hypothetical protein